MMRIDLNQAAALALDQLQGNDTAAIQLYDVYIYAHPRHGRQARAPESTAAVPRPLPLRVIHG